MTNKDSRKLITEIDEKVDVLENRIIELDEEILDLLLIDRTTNSNILWCTDSYSKLGDKYSYKSTIERELITAKNGNIIKPRTKKNYAEKKRRVKEKGEVFTPSWVCNHQNNLVDNAWFGEENLFNYETDKSWVVNPKKIKFINRDWKEFVKDLRIEITCGEAPYIVSRYDTVSNEIIETFNRIGILDRKIRVVNENVSEFKEWYKWIKIAYQSVYGYEWQGDSLLIARENLLYSFVDYYEERFGSKPTIIELKEIADIISWNFWQMDGLKGVVPQSCDNEKIVQYDLFGDSIIEKCIGCTNLDITKHNGAFCNIKDWENKKIVKFVNLLKGENR